MKEMRLGQELKADLEVLRALDGEAFEQVASIAATQLRSGAPGAKAVKNAAAALAVGPEELAAALEALSFVIAEAARLQIPEQDLRAALQEQLPLSGEAVESLVQVALAETPHARSVAADLGHPLPAFRSLDWRLDVQARAPPRILLPRACPAQATPFLMRPAGRCRPAQGSQQRRLATLTRADRRCPGLPDGQPLPARAGDAENDYQARDRRLRPPEDAISPGLCVLHMRGGSERQADGPAEHAAPQNQTDRGTVRASSGASGAERE